MKKKTAVNFIKFSLTSFIFFSLISFVPMPASAAIEDPIVFEPQIGIPGFNTDTTLSENNTSYIIKLIKAFYDYGLSIGGILAAVVLMAGGLIWLTSGGSSDKITQAKGLMIGSIVGIALLFGAWIILNTINPNLVNLKVTDIRTITKMTYGCCQYTDRAEMYDNVNCDKTGGSFMDVLVNNRGVSRNYTLSADGKNCVLPGCCITTYPDTKICTTAVSYNCAVSAKVAFNPNVCSEVVDCTQSYMNSNGSISTAVLDVCQDPETDDGDACFESEYDNTHYGVGCFCYNGVAWRGKGKLGEPCGNENRKSYCTDQAYANLLGAHCDGDHIYHDDGGRNCGTDLWCCYDTRKAQ